MALTYGYVYTAAAPSMVHQYSHYDTTLRHCQYDTTATALHLQGMSDPQRMSVKLMEEALSRGTTDNVSVLVVML
jgi:hypothetical protein